MASVVEVIEIDEICTDFTVSITSTSEYLEPKLKGFRPSCQQELWAMVSVECSRFLWPAESVYYGSRWAFCSSRLVDQGGNARDGWNYGELLQSGGGFDAPGYTRAL